MTDLVEPQHDVPGGGAVWRLDVAAKFLGDDEERLMTQVREAISRSRAQAPAG